MLSFVLGGIYTLAVLAAGIFIGWSIAKGVDDETLEDIKRTTPTRRSNESGSIKPYTKQELANKSDAAIKKMGEVLEGLHRND